MAIKRKDLVMLITSPDHNDPFARPTREPDSDPVAAELPWTLKPSTFKKKPKMDQSSFDDLVTHPSSSKSPATDLSALKSEVAPTSPVTNVNQVTSIEQPSAEPNDVSLQLLSVTEVPSSTESTLPLPEGSPPGSGASTPSTITPLTSGVAITTGSDGDDEKSPTTTTTRAMQLPRKKNPPSTPEGIASSGHGNSHVRLKKKEGKAKESVSDSAKGEEAEQVEEDKDVVALKVSGAPFTARLASNV